MQSPRRPAQTALAVLAGSLIAAACGSTPTAATDLDAVYQVGVEQCSAPDQQLATAVAVDGTLLATVAHSFEDAEAFVVRRGDGVEVPAVIVHLDDAKDVALLRLEDDTARVPFVLAAPPAEGPVSIATAAASDGSPEAKDGTIVDLVNATLNGEGRRAAIKLEADIRPGDSGAAVVDENGRMVGMVFAASRSDRIGWAVAAAEIEAALAAAGDDPIALDCS